MKTVDLVYFNAGGGHRAAALALQQGIAQQQRPWQVRLINLTEVLDPGARLQRLTGWAPEDFYNRRLQRGWTLGLAQELKLLQGVIRVAHTSLVRTLQRHWAASEPDVVVSLIPNFNRALRESVGAALPGVPFVTVLTDMADHPPHFWIEPPDARTRHMPQRIVCGTSRAHEQARAAGFDAEQLVQVSGMLLRPTFYDEPAPDRALRRAALGLDPARPTGVVMFGGQGSRQMLRVARLLDQTQLLMMCGRNESLADELRGLRRKAAQAVLGFTEDVPGMLSLGDFFIGKPGPGALSEAVQMGLPVITWRNAWTMPQERYNAQWVRETGVGTVVSSLAALPAAVAETMGSLDGLQARVRAIRNRALFEVIDVLAQVLQPAPVALSGLAPRSAPAH